MNKKEVGGKFMSDEIRQAHLYLNGYSLRQIGRQEGVSHVTIHNNLVKKLAKAGEIDLYIKVIAKLNDNTPDSISKKEVVERVLNAYHLSVDEDKTIEEIAEQLGASVFTIYRDLTVRLEKLHQKNNGLVTKEMLELSEKVLSRRSLECLIPKMPSKKVPTQKTRLERLYESEEEQFKFLAHAMLTFRVTPKTMSSWLQLDENELYQKLLSYKPNLEFSFQYLVNYECPNQEDAIRKFDEYYRALLKARLLNQKELSSSLIKLISDHSYLAAKKAILENKSIKLEQVGPVIAHIIKYSLSPINVMDSLGITSNLWNRIVYLYFENDPASKDKYENLIHNYRESNFSPGGRKS